MRRYEKGELRKGTFLIGGAFAANGELVDTRPSPRRERDELRRQYPTFESVLEQAGPSPAEVKRLELEAANREIEARIAALKAKAEAFLKKTGRA